MCLRPYVLLVSVLVCVSLRADQITLKNGDRVTGSIIRKDGQKLTIKTAAFGEISAPWDQIDAIATDEPLNVELQTGETLKGKLATQEKKLEVITGDTRNSIEFDKVSALRDEPSQRTYERLLSPPWSRLWTGTVTFALAGIQGNAETRTLTGGMNASRVTRHDKTTVYFNAIKASALVDGISASTAKAVRGGFAYDRNISSRVFLNGFNDYEFDRFQNLELRFVAGGGIGFRVWKREQAQLDVLAGGAFNRETFSSTPI